MFSFPPIGSRFTANLYGSLNTRYFMLIKYLNVWHVHYLDVRKQNAVFWHINLFSDASYIVNKERYVRFHKISFRGPIKLYSYFADRITLLKMSRSQNVEIPHCLVHFHRLIPPIIQYYCMVVSYSHSCCKIL